METRQDVYLVCPRLKGQKKKHVRVCRQCRWNRNCRTYQHYSQIALPLAPGGEQAPKSASMPFRLVSVSPSPTSTPALIDQIRRELQAIRDLLA
jgi:hypothetical protein